MKRILLSLLLAMGILASPVTLQGKSDHKVTPTEAQVIKTALKSVGHVTGLFEAEDGSLHPYGCSAFSIATRKFLTAAHCYGANMTVDGSKAAVILMDVDKDLMVLLADDTRPSLILRAAPLTYLESAIGLGYGYSWLFPTITWHRALMFHYSPFKGVWPGTWFQGGFIGGMSGGPVIDVDGQVVGICQRGNEQSGYGVGVDVIEGFLKGE